MHVDDGVLSGEYEFRRWIKKELQQKFKIQKFVSNKFKFCGLWVEREEDGRVVDTTTTVMRNIAREDVSSVSVASAAPGRQSQ